MGRALIGVCLLALALPAWADSYPDFEDLLEIDRSGTFFAEVRRDSQNSAEKRVNVAVWTRMPAEALKARRFESDSAQAARFVPELSPGPIRTVFKGDFGFHPGLVRISSSALALLDYHAINLAELRRGPAVQVVGFDGTVHLSLRLDQVFTNGIERYHNSRGLVPWLEDAWFDESGRRLVVVSQNHPSNKHQQELAVISLETGKVELANQLTIVDEVNRVEPRFLHSALDVAINHSVDGLDRIAKRIFETEDTPLAARVRAAGFLAKNGNSSAQSLIRELANLQRTDLAEVRHPLVSPSLVFESEYWWNTIGYAARINERLSREK